MIKVRKGGKEELFTVAGGIAEVQPDIVTVLADAAENVEEIDIARAEAARKRAEEALAKGVPADTDAYLAMEAALRKSNLRLDAVRRYRKRMDRVSPYSEQLNHLWQCFPKTWVLTWVPCSLVSLTARKCCWKSRLLLPLKWMIRKWWQ